MEKHSDASFGAYMVFLRILKHDVSCLVNTIRVTADNMVANIANVPHVSHIIS